MLTASFYLIGSEDAKVVADPLPLCIDANNNIKQPLVVKVLQGDGSSLDAYFKICINATSQGVVTTLNEINTTSAAASYSVEWNNTQYPTASQVVARAYSDAAMTDEIGSITVSIQRDQPIPYPRGSWEPSATYYNGQYLLVNNVVYMYINPVAGNTDENPKVYITTHGDNNAFWKSYTKWDLLATNFMLADGGLLGSAVFNNGKLISQQGKVNGVASTDYNNVNFVPNIELDFLTGAASFLGKSVEFKADGTASLGSNINIDADGNIYGTLFSTEPPISHDGTLTLPEVKDGYQRIIEIPYFQITRTAIILTIVCANATDELYCKNLTGAPKNPNYTYAKGSLEYWFEGGVGTLRLVSFSAGASTGWVIIENNIPY